MDQSSTKFDTFWLRIKNNPAIASVMILGTVVIALASFTDAAKSLIELVIRETRPAVNGVWVAEVTYPWLENPEVETFILEGEENILQGTASFLGRDLVILEGTVTGDRIEFVTQSTEYAPDWNDNTTKLATHRYRGQLDGDQIRLVLETYGGFSANSSVEILAERQESQ